MLQKTITYKDYKGNSRTEDFFFNFNKPEMLELETSMSGGLSEAIENIVKTQDTHGIVTILKDIILKAYGEISPDGRRFVKVTDAGVPLSIAFSQTEAYAQLYMELATNSDAAATFFKGIIPEDDGK